MGVRQIEVGGGGVRLEGLRLGLGKVEVGEVGVRWVEVRGVGIEFGEVKVGGWGQGG